MLMTVAPYQGVFVGENFEPLYLKLRPGSGGVLGCHWPLVEKENFCLRKNRVPATCLAPVNCT